MPSEQIILCDREVFAKNFNRLPHEVRHTLTSNPLFGLPALAELSQRVASRARPHHARGDIYIEQGKAGTGKGLDLSDRKADVRSLVAEIEQGQTRVILKHIEREPGYREVFEACLGDILQQIQNQTDAWLQNFESAAITVSGIEQLRQIHEGQFALDRLRCNGQAAPAIWNAVLAA
jgi:hypothetical protein